MSHIIKKYALVYASLVIIFLSVNLIGTDSIRKVFIDGDGSGHYAYLPSLIIYGSVDFTDVFNFEKSQRPPDYMGHYFHKVNGIYINKYTAGTALLQLPFFIIGYLLSLLLGFAPDGYNVVFQYCSALSALFWVGIGLVFLVKFLETYSINKKFAWAMSVVCLFGTNLFFYTFVDSSFSHVYSFSIITLFVYYMRRIFLAYGRWDVVKAAFLLGLIFLIRPANILIVAIIPFLAGSSEKMISAIKDKISNHDYLPAIIAFIVALSPQLIINYLQTGSPIIYGYQNEGFYFTDPQIVNFLISFKKGWFIYTPIFLLLIPGMIYLWRSQTKFSFFSFLFFFVVLVYVFSSWWNWYYGDSFGMRPMVDYYSIFILIIALFIHNTCKKWIKNLAFVFIGLTIILNLIQSYQYAIGIIHADSMTKKAYWQVFLDIDKQSAKKISCGDETFYGRLDENPFFTTYNNIETSDIGWTKSAVGASEFWYSDSLAIKQTPKSVWSPSYKYYIPDSLVGYGNIYVRYNTRYYEEVKDAALKSVFVVDITDETGKNVFYKTFKIKNIPDNIVNEWQLGSIGFKLPKITKDMEFIKFYIWNVGKQTYYIDDLELQFSTYNH